jgi:hypothetical protein
MSKSKNSTRRGGGRSARPDGRRRQQRRISVRSVRRNPPDVRKLGRAIIRMAALEAEAERAAAAEHQAQTEADGQPAGDSHER